MPPFSPPWFAVRLCRPLCRVPVIGITPCERILAGSDSAVHIPVRGTQDRPQPLIEGAIDFSAAKIAAIVLHTVRSLTGEEVRRRALLIPGLAPDVRCSGPPTSLLQCRETPERPAKPSVRLE